MIEFDLLCETVGRIRCPRCLRMTIHVPDDGYSMSPAVGKTHDPECPIVCTECGRVWEKGERIEHIPTRDGQGHTTVVRTFHQVPQAMREAAMMRFRREQILLREQSSADIDVVEQLSRGRDRG